MTDQSDPGYQDFVESCLEVCHCCQECGGFGIPCDGTMAGGICDRMCRCDPDDYEGMNWDDDDDWEPENEAAQ